jgi:hypothetical protein
LLVGLGVVDIKLAGLDGEFFDEGIDGGDDIVPKSFGDGDDEHIFGVAAEARQARTNAGSEPGRAAGGDRRGFSWGGRVKWNDGPNHSMVIEGMNTGDQLNLFTDYDSDSELSRLSQSSGQGQAVVVSPDLWAVLSRAQALAERTEGAFDVTVGPYVNLWRKARRDKALPSAERLARARASVGYRNVRLEPAARTVELMVPDMRLDLGGIAKGYAIDEALKVLWKQGVRSALVSGGGDLAVTAAPPGRKGWRIEVAPLDVEGAPPPRFAHGLSAVGDAGRVGTEVDDVTFEAEGRHRSRKVGWARSFRPLRAKRMALGRSLPAFVEGEGDAG